MSSKLHIFPPMTHRVESEEFFGSVMNENNSIVLSENDEANLSLEKEAIFGKQDKPTGFNTTRPR